MTGRSSGPEARGRSWGRADTRGGHDAGGVRPAGARASRPLPLAGPAGSTRERRERAGVGRWGLMDVGAACPPGGRRLRRSAPTVDWSTAGWGASGPMGAGQPTDGGVAPMREPSALHDGRGWGGAHLQPWPGVDDGGRQAHSDAIVVDGMCGRFGAMGCPPRRAATRRLTGAMIPAPMQPDPSRWDAGCGRVVGMAGEAAPTRGRGRPGCVGRVRVTMHAVTWGPCPPIGRAGRPGCFLTQGGGRCRSS